MQENNNVTIEYESYLTQQKLGEILKEMQWFKRIHCLEIEKKIESTRYSWDFTFFHEDKYYVVEFDGEAHYRDIMTIRNDQIKESILFRNYTHETAKLVRIPFWMQLDNETFYLLFGFQLFKMDIIRNYNHGFVASKHFPASFCHKGYVRYEKELSSASSNVRNELYETLKIASEKYNGWEWVDKKNPLRFMGGD